MSIQHLLRGPKRPLDALGVAGPGSRAEQGTRGPLRAHLTGLPLSKHLFAAEKYTTGLTTFTAPKCAAPGLPVHSQHHTAASVRPRDVSIFPNAIPMRP